MCRAHRGLMRRNHVRRSYLGRNPSVLGLVPHISVFPRRADASDSPPRGGGVEQVESRSHASDTDRSKIRSVRDKRAFVKRRIKKLNRGWLWLNSLPNPARSRELSRRVQRVAAASCVPICGSETAYKSRPDILPFSGEGTFSYETTQNEKPTA